MKKIINLIRKYFTKNNRKINLKEKEILREELKMYFENNDYINAFSLMSNLTERGELERII